MKKAYLFIFIIVLFSVPNENVSAQHSHFSCYHNHGYYYDGCYGIVIMDSAYFSRLDAINQAKYNEELEQIGKAYDYLEKGDYDMAVFYARKVSSFNDLLPDRYIVLTLSSAYLNNKSALKMYYKKLQNYCNPRQIEDVNNRLEAIKNERKATEKEKASLH